MPVSQTRCRTSTSTRFFAGLDRDTRDYLRLLLAGGGEGLKGNGRNFANAFRRFEPLNRDIAKLTGEVAQAAQEPGAPDPQLPAAGDRARHARTRSWPSWVVSQNAVFQAFANQDAQPARDVPGCCRARSSPPTRR